MPQIRMRENRINGLFPLSYVGVIPVSPQNFIMATGAPTSADAKNFYIGDLWLDTSTDTAAGGYIPPTIANLWILVSLDRGVATWIPFGGGSGTVLTLTGNTGGPVSPLAGNINTVGDNVGITVAGNPGTHTLTWSLVGGGTAAQSFPTDSGTATPNASGVLNIITSLATNAAGITTFFSGSGDTVLFNNTDANDNVAFGKGAGKVGMSGLRNSAFGRGALNSITTGDDNTAIGFAALSDITTPSDNIALGSGALLSLVTGSRNTAIGLGSGSSYTGAESNNILVGHVGVLGESNTTRLGTSGGGGGQQNRCFVGGVDGVNVGSTAKVVTMGTAGTVDQLGTAVITAGSGITVTPGANTITIAATTAEGIQFLSASVFAFETTRSTAFEIMGGYNPLSTAIADTGAVMPIAGTFNKLYVRCFFNTDTGNVPVSLNKNGVTTALTITVPAGTTGTFTDLVDNVTVAIGDLVCWEVGTASAANSMRAIITCLFTPA